MFWCYCERSSACACALWFDGSIGLDDELGLTSVWGQYLGVCVLWCCCGIDLFDCVCKETKDSNDYVYDSWCLSNGARDCGISEYECSNGFGLYVGDELTYEDIYDFNYDRIGDCDD